MRRNTISQPCYKRRPITSIAALAATLSLPKALLEKLATRREEFYAPGPTQIKGDGTPRFTWKAKRPLERVHEAIKRRLFLNVKYPQYLHGSLRGRSALSNARVHAHARILMGEDITAFFDSITEEQVCRIWRECFRFSEDVSRLLAALTTKQGALPQGAKTSSDLANLVLGQAESRLVDRLDAKGINYTRYVDDISMSAPAFIVKPVQTDAIRQLYGLLKHEGLRPKRQKHRVMSSREPMVTTGIQVNRLPSLSKKLRHKVRAAVFQLERSAAAGSVIPDSLLRSVAGRVGRLVGFGSKKAIALQARLSALRCAQSRK